MYYFSSCDSMFYAGRLTQFLLLMEETMAGKRNLRRMLLLVAVFGIIAVACKSTPVMTARENQSIVSQGTGFFISADGYVVTCEHVVSEANTIGVWVGGNAYRAELVAIDKDTDIAILKIDYRPSHFFRLANFNSARRGDRIYAFGFPLTSIWGSEIRITDGIISALTGLDGSEKDFQISAPI